MHLGFRHLAPVLPFLILGAGFALDHWAARPAGRAAAVALLLWLAIGSARVYPQGISYFNEWIGGPENRRKYLADSNIDWGRNLPELANYVVQNRVPKIRISYCGPDQIGHYLPQDRFEPVSAPFDASWTGQKQLQAAPGTYAISVNWLLGYTLPPACRDYFVQFRNRRPDARAGYSILIYHVPE